MNALWKRLWTEEDGLGMVELVIIIAVIVVLAIAFREQIKGFLTRLFTKVDKQTDEIFK